MRHFIGQFWTQKAASPTCQLSSRCLALGGGAFPVFSMKCGKPCVLDLVWLQPQSSLGSELRAQCTICSRKTLKGDHGADRILPTLVPGAAFFSGFTFGWGLMRALQVVMSPKKKSGHVLGGCRVDRLQMMWRWAL